MGTGKQVSYVSKLLAAAARWRAAAEAQAAKGRPVGAFADWKVRTLTPEHVVIK
jgi:hypothetical protein